MVLLLLQVQTSSAQFIFGGFPFGVTSPFQGYMYYWPGGVPATYSRLPYSYPLAAAQYSPGMGGYGMGGMGYGAGYPMQQTQPSAVGQWPPSPNHPNGLPIALASENVWEPSALPATIHVTLPEDAQLLFDGEKTNQTGSSRVFTTPPLEKGGSYHYDLVATWSKDGKQVEKKKRVDVHSGANVRVSLEE
jgi:uncharacterized protein (TIGR03000 family)